MGVEYYVVCSTHLEKLWMGKLYFLEDWVRELVETKNTDLVWTPTPLQHMREEVKKFKMRHSTDECVLGLINDHADDFLEPEFVYYRDPSWGAPLPTKEELELYVKAKEKELIEGDSQCPDIPPEFIEGLGER